MNMLVKVNEKQSVRIGQIISKYSIREDFYKREFLNVNLDTETKLRIYFFSVAICHQTYNLKNIKLNLFGWDYLEHIFLKLSKGKSELLDPDFLAEQNNEDLVDLLKCSFSEDNNPESCTLDRLEERASFLIEIGKILKNKYHSKVAELIKSTNSYLINNNKGFYEILPEFKSYSDPYKKKITFFLKLVSDAGLIKIKDVENFIPIMDYHMQRVLLRIGCVEINDEDLKYKLQNKIKIPSDKEIRVACIEAIKIIAETSLHHILMMNDFFWSLGRSCCNNTCLCVDKKCEKYPCSFFQLVEINIHKKCIFEECCKAYKYIDYRKIFEPIIDTYFY